MNIGVLGTGVVGATLASKLVALGHSVKMGSRDARNEKALRWAESAGKNASSGTFADAAAFGEIVLNATAGTGSLDALRAAGQEPLRGKVLIDVSNALDFSRGMPPTLFTAAEGESLAEKIQKILPDTKVVKTLNTVNASVMVDPARVGGDSDVFLAGDDPGAKERVAGLLGELGWKKPVDLGGLEAARGMEAYVLFWLTVFVALKSPDFNVRIVRR